MGLDSHSTLLMVRPIHLGLRTSCPSRLMAALVCLTVDAWLPYPRKHGFSINLDEPLVVIAAQSNVIQREGHELMFFGPDSPRLTDRSRLVFKSNSGGNRNDRSGVFLSPSSQNWLSCFVLDSGEAVHFLPQPGTNSVIRRNAGVHIDFLVYRLVEGVISWIDWNVEKLPVLIQLSIKGFCFDLMTWTVFVRENSGLAFGQYHCLMYL